MWARVLIEAEHIGSPRAAAATLMGVVAPRRIGVGTFLTGDAAVLDRLVGSRPVRFELVVVQPGVSRSNLEPKLAEVLGAAASHLIRAGHREMRVITSA